MPRHAKPSELSLHSNQNGPENGVPHGPNSSPMNLQGVDLESFSGGFEHDVAASLTPIPAVPQSPGSPRTTAQNGDPPKGFLNSWKSKMQSPEQEQRPKKTTKETRQGGNEGEDQRPATSSMTQIYHLRQTGSQPQLSQISLRGSQENVLKDGGEGDKPPLPGPRPQPTPHHSEDSTTNARRRDNTSSTNKGPFRFGVTRSKSIRRDSESKSRPRQNGGNSNGKNSFEQKEPPNTAPLQSDWPGSDSRMGAWKGKEKDKRGKSAERAPANESEENLAVKQASQKSGGFKMGSKNVMSKAKSGGGHFLNRLGKIGRSTSSTDKEIPDSEYKLKVINLPLIEQTRATRISKQLSGCRDKTEYWMPSLPWRCIDYLNTNCEEEGLYRVPGSGPKVKHWQRRFDQELDIDLLSEDVPDTNEIASMLKAWLRELPTEIMPLWMQQDLAVKLQESDAEYKNVGKPATQQLRDALSDLPPFNYYLLFAITCHLSLLLTNKDRNKMDLHNLYVCVGPCLSLERWLFNYLVGDWRHCWQGCYTEKEALRKEQRVEAGLDPDASDDGDDATAEVATADDGRSENVSYNDERAISSGSGSAASKLTTGYDDSKPRSRDASTHNLAENNTPLAHGARTQPNGSFGLGIGEEPKRPRTADQRNAPSEGMKDGSSVTKNRSNSSTPKIGGSHNRSRSDLPATPVKTQANADWGMPMRPS